MFLTYAEVTRERFIEGRVRAVRETGGDGTEIIFVEHDHDPDPSDSTIECGYIYLIRENGAFRVETDRHLTGIFAEARWPALLEAAGFKTRALMIDVWDEAEEKIPTFLGIKP